MFSGFIKHNNVSNRYQKERNISKRLEKKQGKKNTESVPKRPLTNIDLKKFTVKLRIQYIRGVHVKDDLLSRPLKNKSAIISLDNISGEGIH